jgi:hypothetical protein
MAKGPEDAPLGATPMLPPPTGAAAERAEGAFKDYLERLRTEGPALEPPPAPPAAPAPAGEVPDAESFGGGRRYDLALSKVGRGAPAPPQVETMEPVAPPTQPEPETVEAEDPEESPAEDAADVPARPPPGAPFVRPPVTRGPGPEAVSQDLLETAADSAMLRTDPDGTSSFDIAFSDDLFHDLACRITVNDGRVVATFRVHDDNTRRLLEAEAGRLRVRLEERGLRVGEVRVEVEG